MKAKWTLFAGLAILAIGIVLRNALPDVSWPAMVIATGILFKVYFVVQKIRKSKYRPGFEMLLLLLGLTLFFLGGYLASHGTENNSLIPAFLRITGISLKVAFIVLFIRKTNNN